MLRRRPMAWLAALAASTALLVSLHVLVTSNISDDAPPSLRWQQTGDTPVATATVLLPDWEALLLLPRHYVGAHAANYSCRFHNGASSGARLAGVVPSSVLAAFRCAVPRSIRGLRPLLSPLFVGPLPWDEEMPPLPRSEMLRWTRVVYEAVSTADDVVVFAKGVNSRGAAGFLRDAAGLRCVYSSHADDLTITLPATSSAQEVFRCPHPPPEAAPEATLTVSLSFAGEETPLPTLATYDASPPSKAEERAVVCACTMVYNAAKFLSEWVAYHAAVGVERFFFYDNGSDDDMDSVVANLTSRGGYNVSTRFWPWPKTQEAGFSHCAVTHAAECQWMAFIDVDEFIFMPAWARRARPDKCMVQSLVAVQSVVGQVVINCLEFGPSGRKAHPEAGVTQGYTCRRSKSSRHKSLVRLDAVHESLLNSVHHFWLRDGFTTLRARSAVVNHYKYQAWAEFKGKFRRRVSAYVADWTDAAGTGSQDRVPGLGLSAVEPKGWYQRFCKVKDRRLRDTVRRWFRPGLPGTRWNAR